MNRNLSIILLGVLAQLLFSCDKTQTTPNPNPDPNPKPTVLSYGDSILYIKNQASDYIVLPNLSKAGTYLSFPEGMEIDPSTGAINVSKTDAGLKYKVSFIETGKKDTVSTFVTISGINYLDGFYKLTTADSIIRPLYNANPNISIPGINSGSLFDLGSGCNSQGCTVNATDGKINLAETVRNGVFGSTPSNNDRHEFELNYQINDKSGKATNTLKVKLYYFNTVNDITPEAYDIIASRQGTIFLTGLQTPVATQAKVGKPRPPCIFIVGH